VPYGTDSRLVAFQAMNCLATIISPFGTTNPLSTFSKPHQTPNRGRGRRRERGRFGCGYAAPRQCCSVERNAANAVFQPKPWRSASASDPDPVKAQEQLCETWYYIGMKDLLSGDKKQASDDFRRCIATKRTQFVEYILSKAELASL
jgi:hypothetical protein